MSIVNISAYKFISLDDLPALREWLLACCEALALKGTILLAAEGINLFLAGSREQIDGFMSSLHEDPRFADIEPKESLSDDVPFGRMRVRIKREIITMQSPTIRPEGGRAPAVDAPTLQRWLDQGHDDEGREVVLLDTRNDYETDLGKFAQAVDYRIASFTAFPAAIAADSARFAGKTLVSYCTGGIRCEKAVLHMQNLGMQHVYQLDGGILKYLEQTDGTHWQGDCFVFDGRVAVDTNLLPLPHGRPSGSPLAGERAGVRGHAGEEADSEHASMNSSASTRPSPQSSPQRGEDAKATSAMLHKGGLYIDQRGHGPVQLVLLHGWAMHGGVLEPLVEALQDHCTMHVVDLPGHGYSRDCGLPLEPRACAAAIAAQTPPAIWLGWSLGGLIALTAALELPGQVRALAMLCATPKFVRDASWASGSDAQLAHQLASDLETDYHATLERFLALEAMGSADPRAELRHLRELVFARGEPDLRVLQEGIRILETSDRRAALPDLAVRSAWISGRRDRLVPPQAMAWSASQCGGQYTEIPQAGHAPFFGHVDALVQALQPLLTRMALT